MHARVLLGLEVPALVLLVPVQDAPHEGRDEERAGLSGRYGLGQREHEGQVAVDAVLALQGVGGLDALPGAGDLDEDALLADPDRLVQVDDVQRLVDAGLRVEAEARVDLGAHLARDDLQDLLAELDQQPVQRGVDLVVLVLALRRETQQPAPSPRGRASGNGGEERVRTCSLPYWTATSISLAYSGFLAAARMSDGFVVASCGLYLSMVAKSPESQTTV